MSTKRRAPKKKFTPKKKAKTDPLDRWALEPGFKPNLKRCDQTTSNYFVTNTSAAAVNLISVPQAVGDNSRVGQRIRLFNLKIRGFISFYPAATGIVQCDTLRLIIVYDRQTNGVAPTWANLILNIGAGTSTAFDPPNWYERGRYKILRDYHIPVPAMTATVAAGLITAAAPLTPPAPTSTELQLDFFKALKGKLDTIYSGTGATTANINGGAIFVFAQCSQGTGWWNYDFTSSIEFMDV